MTDPINQVNQTLGDAITCALRDVIAERARQSESCAYTAEHDRVEHADGTLARAAACYAYPMRHPIPGYNSAPLGWPSNWTWNPKDRRRDLVRAGALILAEIERLDNLPPYGDQK